MRKLVAPLAAVALASGMALAGTGVAFADTNTSDDHSDDHHNSSQHDPSNCHSGRHSLANVCGVKLLGTGDIL